MQNDRSECSIEIGALRSALDLILDHIEHDLKIKELKVSHDKEYYWDMSIENRFKIAESPPILSIGKLGDDIDFLNQMVREAKGDTSQAPSVMLMHVTPILILLANVVGG